MPESLRNSIEQAVRKAQGCAWSHAGTFFVEEIVKGQPHKVAVEIFQLQGHPEATQAFAWAWDDDGERRYIGVLSMPPIDTPQDAVRAAIASRDQDSPDMAHSVSGMVPGSHFKMVPCTPKTNADCAFEFLGNYTVFRPVGNLSFYDAVSIISESLSFATFLSFDRLLVDATQLTGFPSPTAWQRCWMAMEWAATTGSLHLAVVAKAELIDPARFGVAVARNRGLFANVFTSEREAAKWLLHPDPE
jgi:hypothetical protein